jgi:segregation and condensation protein A
VLERYGEEKKEVRHSVVRYAYTIDGQKVILTERLSKDTPTAFEVLFADCENRIHAVFNFLALLELVAQQLVDIQLRDGFNNFVVLLLEVDTESHPSPEKDNLQTD